MRTVTLPFALTVEDRDGTTSRDARLINGFWERKGEKDFDVFKRVGLSDYKTVAAAATARGMFNWNGNIYILLGGTLYSLIGGTIASVGAITAPTWNSPVVPMQANLAATPQLLIQTGSGNAKYYNGTLNTISSANDGVSFPANTVPGAVYLDETMYVMDTNAAIWGSGLEDLTTWSSLNKIVAYVEPDKGVALYKQLVYVIAFKTTSVEVFYDAASSSGSPLGAVQGSKVSVGCIHAGTIQDIDGRLVWVCTHKSGAYGVMLMENVQSSPIDTPDIRRILQQCDFTGDVYSWQAVMQGHQFYGLTIENSNITLVYDLTSKMWAQWTDASGNFFPFSSAVVGPAQEVLMQHHSDGHIYKLDPTAVIDAWSAGSTAIVWEMYTPIFTGDTELGKYYDELRVFADQKLGSKLFVRWSDDDYQTWSNWRELDLSIKEPFIEGLGTASRRAFHFKHTAQTPLRIRAVKLRLDVCTL